MRAVRQPRRTRERRTTSVESAAVGFIQFIIYKSAISDDIIFLSLFLSSATTKRMNRHRSLVRRRRYVVVVREGVFVGFIETEKRSLVVFTTVLGARTLTEALKARSIRFGFGQIRSKIVALRKREKTARFCLEGARKRDERSVGTVSIFRGKVVSIIPLRVIFVVLVECPFGISDLSLDLMNEREREIEEYRTRRAKTNETRSFRPRGQRILSDDDDENERRSR